MKAIVVQPTFDRLLSVPRDNERLIICNSTTSDKYVIKLRHIYPDNTMQDYEVSVKKDVTNAVKEKYTVLMEVLRRLHDAQVSFDEEEKKHVNKSGKIIEPAKKHIILPS